MERHAERCGQMGRDLEIERDVERWRDMGRDGER